MTARHDDVRARALEDLRRFEVVMDGHFDYGNGFHGNLYLNPHQLFQFPSTIWRVAQDLIEVTPSELIEQADIVAGPATGGALLAHTMAGLLDGKRAMTRPPYLFAPFGDVEGRPSLSPFYASRMAGGALRSPIAVNDGGKMNESSRREIEVRATKANGSGHRAVARRKRRCLPACSSRLSRD